MALSEAQALSKKQMTMLRNLARYGWNGIAMSPADDDDDVRTLMRHGLMETFHNRMGFLRYHITPAGRAALSGSPQ